MSGTNTEQAGDKRPIQVFNMETMAAHFGRFARTEDYQREDLPPVNYAYHLDAGRYARFLRGYAEKRGVVRREGKVADVALDRRKRLCIVSDDGQWRRRSKAICSSIARAFAGC